MTGLWETPQLHARNGLEPSVQVARVSSETCLQSIAISLKRIADALTPQDGASSCEIVQQVSEMLAAQPRAPFGNRPRDL